MRIRRRSVIAWLLAMALLAPSAAVAQETGPTITPLGDDVRVLIGEPSGLTTQASDPLGLLVGIDTLRDHSLGPDVLDVWACGVGESASTLASQLTANVGSYFNYHSRGRYQPQFIARGYAGNSNGECEQTSVTQASPNANGAIHVTPTAGGFASPGYTCGYSPCGFAEFYGDGNGRSGFIGNSSGFYATAAHEMGHMIQWPHSYTGLRQDFMGDYDNALDLMSGNYGTYGGGGYGSYPDPYSSAVVNFYAAGWIDPHEVYVFGGGGASFNLATAGGNGHRMAVIRAGSKFYTLAARIPSTYDPIPAHWSGVEVYEVEVCAASEMDCLLYNDDKLPGFRRVKPHPAVSFAFENSASYSQPLAHVISPGSSATVAGVQVSVGVVSGQTLAVSMGSNPQPIPDPEPGAEPPPATGFTDTAGHVFAGDIDWLAAAGITKGCNPPGNTLFCPDSPVTRGQMAAFLHRALPDLPVSAAVDFADDNGSVFESDIEWLAATGVTRGCNPPANDRFCPDSVVTRGQMAAFLHRALPDLEFTGPMVDFTDDNASVFESDIEWLAATGVTRGCNPPANSEFCPSSPVTRGAMAAFLHRALGG
jgi:hypothetical protein